MFIAEYDGVDIGGQFCFVCNVDDAQDFVLQTMRITVR